MRGVGRGTSLSTAARFRTPWNMCGTLYRETGPPVWEGNTQRLLPLFPSAFENAQAGGRWPNRHASATAERWSKTGPGPPGEELCPSRKAHSGRKAVTWGITRGCSAAVWRSARQFLPDRTDGEPRAAVASSGGPGHQLSYLRGAETALLRLTMRNTKKSDSYSASQLPDGSTASTITVVH